LAAHSQQIGAGAIAAMPPSFFKPTTVAQAVDFMKPIAAAAGDLPFYYYHIPSMTGVTLSMVELIETATREIPTFRGLKFTHNDLTEFQRCHRLLGTRGDIAWGSDEMLLAAWMMGAVTAVGSTYNFAAPLYTKMLAAFAAGDNEAARACSRQVADMVGILQKFGGRRTGKALMELVGINCGPSRPPQPSLPPADVLAVREAFVRIGLDWLFSNE
jgi:N-acetylneuraminate lyase